MFDSALGPRGSENPIGQHQLEEHTFSIFCGSAGKKRRYIYGNIANKIWKNFHINGSEKLHKNRLNGHCEGLRELGYWNVRESKRFLSEGDYKVQDDIWMALEITESDHTDVFELRQQAYLIGDGLRQVKDGQHHLKKAIGELDRVLSVAFCVGAGLVYGISCSYLVPIFFGIYLVLSY